MTKIKRTLSSEEQQLFSELTAEGRDSGPVKEVKPEQLEKCNENDKELPQRSNLELAIVKYQPENQRKRVMLPDYDEILFKNMNSKTVSPKCVYVSEKTHRDLTAIISRLTTNQVSIANYVENIIRQHFDFYKDEINQRYKRKSDILLE